MICGKMRERQKVLQENNERKTLFFPFDKAAADKKQAVIV